MTGEPVTRREYQMLHEGVAAAVKNLGNRLTEYHDENGKRLDDLGRRMDTLQADHGKTHVVAVQAAAAAEVAAKEAAATNGRLRKIEEWKSFVHGGGAVLTFIIGSGVGVTVAVVILRELL